MVSSVTIASEGTYGFAYDEMGRNTLLSYPDGHRREQRYDELGRIVERCYRYSTPSGADHCYGAQYDPVGNIVRLTDPEGEDIITVDALDRITSVTRAGSPDEVYEYNALGALKRNGSVVLDTQRPRLDGAGLADSAIAATLGGQPITLDTGGRVTRLRDQTLRWSNLSTLHSVVGTGPTITFGLSDRGERVWQFDGTREAYLYSGENRIATLAVKHLPPPVDQDVTYVRDAWFFEGVDHPLRWRHEGVDPVTDPSRVVYYELDLASNVRRLRDPSGADLGGYRYTAFGKTITESGPTQPLRWKGRWHQTFGTTEIYDIRARQWCPELGAFLSIDDYKFRDGVNTLWSWPFQNPIRYRDPSGHIGMGDSQSSDRAIGSAQNWNDSDFRGALNDSAVIDLAVLAHFISPLAFLIDAGLAVSSEKDLYKLPLLGATSLSSSPAGVSCPIGGTVGSAERTAPRLADLAHVNPTGCGTNCLNTAIATDATLAGSPASALPGPAEPAEALSAFYGREGFTDVGGRRGLENFMRAAGDGSRAIVVGERASGGGHAFNAVNYQGRVILLDGQRGVVPSLAPYSNLRVLLIGW